MLNQDLLLCRDYIPL